MEIRNKDQAAIRNAFDVLGRAMKSGFRDTASVSEIGYLRAITTLLTTPEFLKHIYEDYASMHFEEWIGRVLSGRGDEGGCLESYELRELACPAWYAEEEAMKTAVVALEDAAQHHLRELQRAELRREMDALQEKLDSLAEQVKVWQ